MTLQFDPTRRLWAKSVLVTADSRLYGHGFFEGHVEGTSRSADVVVPLILELITPQSVVDVGCGTGNWLTEFQKHGVTDVRGIDGPYVPLSLLAIPPERFTPHDLNKPLVLDQRFDLVLSLEVAEHLPPAAADTFVDTLVALGPVVLFSAAIPFQGGVNHLNEQWPDYWASRFRDREFLPFDCIRGRIWNDHRVSYWYAQNMILYVESSHPLASSPEIGPSADPLPLVHPRLLARLARRRKRFVPARRFMRKVLSIGTPQKDRTPT